METFIGEKRLPGGMLVEMILDPTDVFLAGAENIFRRISSPLVRRGIDLSRVPGRGLAEIDTETSTRIKTRISDSSLSQI